MPTGSQSLAQSSNLPGCLYHRPFPLDGNAGGAATTVDKVAANATTRGVSISANLWGKELEVESTPETAYITRSELVRLAFTAEHTLSYLMPGDVVRRVRRDRLT